MRNKLEAVKYFCSAAETLNFRETAQRFNISPSVITRMINELEAELGEPLFKRNTRNIRLTYFGEQFLPKATQWLYEGERLFEGAKQHQEMAGIVRITVPSWRHHDEIIQQLLTALLPYPDIIIDWREDMGKLDMVADRIDIGVRVGLEPEPDFIVRKIAEIGDMLVASPKLLEKYGKPASIDDLQYRYPFAIPINASTGRAWNLTLNDSLTLRPKKQAFYSVDNYSALQAVLLGSCAGLINDFQAKPYLQRGELVQLFPDIEIEQWQLYLYRPYQTITSASVLKVFDLLTEILRRYYLE